jgi:hypothetical protein
MPPSPGSVGAPSLVCFVVGSPCEVSGTSEQSGSPPCVVDVSLLARVGQQLRQDTVLSHGSGARVLWFTYGGHTHTSSHGQECKLASVA